MHDLDFYDIKLPKCTLRQGMRLDTGYLEDQTVLHGATKESDCRILGSKSSRRLKLLAEEIGVLFRREGSFDCRPYSTSNAMNTRDRLFLWARESWTRKSDVIFAYGAAGVNWVNWSDSPPGYELSWIWFHPFEREHGHLTAVWPYFITTFPDMWVQYPLSRAMEGFLHKVGYDAYLAKRGEEARARSKAVK